MALTGVVAAAWKSGCQKWKGKDRALDHERDQQEGDADAQQRLARVGRDAHGQVGHVQRAVGDVEHADGQQQRGRGQQADVEILQRGLCAVGVVGDGGQDRAGEDQQLGKDEQVEQVAGQKGAGQAGGQRQEEHVEGRVADHLVLAAHGVDHAHQQHNLGHDGHGGRQQVAHHDDAERRLPAAQRIDQRLAAAPHLRQQQHAGRQRRRHHSQRPACLPARPTRAAAALSARR